MTATAPTLQSASLYFREGNSDKEYRAAIEPKDGGFVVNFAYGRRGGTLNTGTKTTVPVTEAEATKVFDKLVASKVAKGYRPIANTNAPLPVLTGREGLDGGVRCQLLNPIEETDVARLLTDNRHCLQEKHDGRRLMVRKVDHEITGINRRGLIVANHQLIELPQPYASGPELLAALQDVAGTPKQGEPEPCDPEFNQDWEADMGKYAIARLHELIDSARVALAKALLPSIPRNLESVHCLGVAAGDVEILHWEDQPE